MEAIVDSQEGLATKADVRDLHVTINELRAE